MTDTCARCRHRRETHVHGQPWGCVVRTGGVPGFPTTAHPCPCDAFVEPEETAA